MGKAAERILDGFRKSLSFARGECRHDWEEVIVRDHAKANHISRIRKCRHCGVRLIDFERRKLQ